MCYTTFFSFFLFFFFPLFFYSVCSVNPNLFFWAFFPDCDAKDFGIVVGLRNPTINYKKTATSPVLVVVTMWRAVAYLYSGSLSTLFIGGVASKCLSKFCRGKNGAALMTRGSFGAVRLPRAQSPLPLRTPSGASCLVKIPIEADNSVLIVNYFFLPPPSLPTSALPLG